MIKLNSKSLSNIEEILLNEEIPLYKITLNRKSIFDGKGQTLRWYIPNWNKIINDGHLFNLLIEKKIINSQQRKHQFTFIQIYLLLTFLPTPNSKRENFTGRRNRTFNLNTLLFDPTFNDKLLEFDGEEHWKLKSYLRRLSQSEKEKQINEILKKKIYPWLETKTPIKELINKAFLEKRVESPLSKMGDEYFTTKVFHNAVKILNDKFIDRDLVSDPLSVKDIEYIRKNLLPDPVLEELRDEKLNSLLEKFEEPYKKIYDLIEEQKRNKATSVIIDSTIYKNIYLRISQELIDHLRAKQNRKFSKAKITELDEVINFVVQMRNLPDIEKWKGLLLTRDRFYKQAESLYSFVNKLENEVKKHLRTYSLLIRNELVSQEKLTRAEVRLYIISNLGLPSLEYSQPILERGLFEFFNFNKFVLPLFIEVMLNKVSEFDNINLKELLEYQFRTFLIFYPVWHENIKISEKERKKDIRKQKKTNPLNTAYHKDKAASDPLDLVDLIGCEEKLLKICSKRELEIFTEKELFYKPLIKIATEQKVSPQMIGKIYRRAKEKIKKFYSI